MGYCVESGDMYFSGYSNETLELLCDIFEKVTYFVYVDVEPHEFTLSVFCIVVNILHCVILSQNAMKTSSIFIIIKYVALMDIISSLYYIEETINILSTDYFPCRSYTVALIFSVTRLASKSVMSYIKRCSTWLNFSIALMRTLVLKYPMSSRISKLSNPKTASYILLTVVIVCLPIQLLDFFKYDFVINKEFRNCVDDAYFYFFTSNFFIANDNLVQKLQFYTDGITSKVIPCILFPVSTCFLIKEIRKASIQRKKMMSTGSTSSMKTSLMVLFLAITFFIAEFPLGIMFLLNPMFTTQNDYGPNAIHMAIEQILVFISSATTVTHMFICFFMSSQYRETALMVARGGYPWKQPEIPPIIDCPIEHTFRCGLYP